jgi:hypothetical protein
MSRAAHEKPQQSQRIAGVSFWRWNQPHNINDLACRFKSPRNHIHNRIKAKISQAAGSLRGVDSL